MLKTIIATAAAALVSFAIVQPASAGVCVSCGYWNGVSLNGVDVNGIKKNGVEDNGRSRQGVELNGIKKNGVRKNGAEDNGVRKNGIKKNGETVDASSFAIVGIELLK